MRRMLLRVPGFNSTWWQSCQLHKTWLSYEENAVESAWITSTWQSCQQHKTWLSYEENAVESAWITSTWQSCQQHKTWLSYEENAVESAWIQLNVVAVLSTAQNLTVIR